MTGKLLQPVVFNVITIVAMLYCLTQWVIAGTRLHSSSTGITLTLEELAQEGEPVDENLVATFVADQDQRRGLYSQVMVIMVIAILANVVANYLGRGRHHENTSRIRELEAELRGLREG